MRLWHFEVVQACWVAGCFAAGAVKAEEPAVLETPVLRLELAPGAGSLVSTVSLRGATGGWEPVLQTQQAFLLCFPPPPAPPAAPLAEVKPPEREKDKDHPIRMIRGSPAEVAVEIHSGLGWIRREFSVDPVSPDILRVRVTVTPERGGEFLSLEDRYTFVPERRADAGPLSGPLDFIWAPKVKARPECLVPHWDFKSPAVMFQQGELFAALVPELSGLTAEGLKAFPPALDLDVMRESRPWISCGVVSSAPEGHSHFARSAKPLAVCKGEPFSYAYRIVVSREPPRLGYRRIVRMLWESFGRATFQETLDLQRNVLKPELWLFDDWRKEAWHRYANEIWKETTWEGHSVGTLASRRRNGRGQLVDDIWFNAWFQTLRTAYSWRLYGDRVADKEVQRRALAVLDLALRLPRQNGVFPTVGRFERGMEHPIVWYRDNKFAGFVDCYHTFDMSWTALWVLRFGHLIPERAPECLKFCREYGDFLVEHQTESGCIPSWYDKTFVPRKEFSDFNAETAPSALFLIHLYRETGDEKYLAAAKKGMDFTTREVLPRHRWFDYETFLSCSKKPFDFYDASTAQYPQNNLCMIQTAQSYLDLYQVTKEKEVLETGRQVLDYLLLTQQMMNHPRLSPKMVGGFTTQNSDAEWSDARQCYAATLLLDYYNATGVFEYLERAVAAARSTFAVAPYENWAHKGFENEHGAMTGFHWGTGSAMASIEMMCDELADAYIDIERGHGVGFNACTVKDVTVSGGVVGFDLVAAEAWGKKTLKIRLRGDGKQNYRVRINGKDLGQFPGDALIDWVAQPPR